jgi:hypothetical protein
VDGDVLQRLDFLYPALHLRFQVLVLVAQKSCICFIASCVLMRASTMGAEIGLVM